MIILHSDKKYLLEKYMEKKTILFFVVVLFSVVICKEPQSAMHFRAPVDKAPPMTLLSATVPPQSNSPSVSGSASMPPNELQRFKVWLSQNKLMLAFTIIKTGIGGVYWLNGKVKGKNSEFVKKLDGMSGQLESILESELNTNQQKQGENKQIFNKIVAELNEVKDSLVDFKQQGFLRYFASGEDKKNWNFIIQSIENKQATCESLKSLYENKIDKILDDEKNSGNKEQANNQGPAKQAKQGDKFE